MNDPNKRIDVNISSLLSLKAELLRKQEEVNRVKSTKSIENFVPSKIPKPENVSTSSKPVAQETKTVEKTTIEEIEDVALLAKSKRVLEMKSKYYDRMAKSGGSLNSDENCLVMFNKKMQDTKLSDASSDDSDSDSIDENKDDYSSKNPDEDWVEYTDCFGRTRKCLRKDLDFMKRKDGNISNEVGAKPDEPVPANPTWIIDTEGNTSNKNDSDESGDELLKIGIKEQMKQEWERKERENVEKEFIHYQDVLFDEARTHGVGYYQFSTDDVERERQREELDKLRDFTLDEQKKREDARKMREKIIAERVRAAKNRQRARQGLPPLEDEPQENKQEPLYDTTEEQERKDMEEKLKQQQEKDEKQRERSRKQYVRPWDKGKDNVKSTTKSDDGSDDEITEWEYKPEKVPLSQEQWNARKREERPKEFAPLYHSVNTQFSEPEQKPITKSFFQRNKNVITPIEEECLEAESKSLFFTTKKPPKPAQINPISNKIDDVNVNETDDDDDYVDDRLPQGIEIPPPPTFEYYGPSSSKKARIQKPSRDQLESSIEAGLKYLREQSDKNASSGGKRVWTSKADY